MFYMIKSNTHQPGLVGSLLASIYYKNNINLVICIFLLCIFWYPNICRKGKLIER
jgi:hypothetical protein